MASTSSPSSILAEGWWPVSDVERDAVLRQLDRILASPAFRSSKRYPALLKFIVEQTLDGHGESMKERTLGVEVFGRTPDYDTNSDHVVRTAAGEVRKRLAQFYIGIGCDDEIRIDVPSGSYVAQFRLISEPASSQQLIPTVPAETLAEIPAPRRSWRSKPSLRLSLAVNALLIAIIATILAVGNLPWIGGTSTLHKFWDPVFASDDPVLICVGLQDGGPRNSAQNQPDASPGQPGNEDPLFHRVAMADLLTLARVTNYAGERHARYRILDPESTSFSDLRNEPTILIGVGNNNWTKQLGERLRFSFLTEGSRHPTAILDKQNPGHNNWVRNQHAGSESFKDYAIVSRLVDPRIEQLIVMVGGLGPHGTEVAGEFITNPDQMKKLEGWAPAGWSGKDLQVVLSTEVVKGSSGPPKIEAAWFW